MYTTTYTAITYLIYTVLSIGLTIWVARILFQSGQIFLIEAFDGNKEMASAVNKLLAVGFYLVNIGFVAFFLRFGEKPTDLVEAIEYISIKMGVVLFFLGTVHIFNVFNFGRMRSKARKRQAEIAKSINRDQPTPQAREEQPVATAA